MGILTGTLPWETSNPFEKDVYVWLIPYTDSPSYVLKEKRGALSVEIGYVAFTIMIPSVEVGDKLPKLIEILWDVE